MFGLLLPIQDLLDLLHMPASDPSLTSLTDFLEPNRSLCYCYRVMGDQVPLRDPIWAKVRREFNFSSSTIPSTHSSERYNDVSKTGKAYTRM
jgi:hypothetical protein